MKTESDTKQRKHQPKQQSSAINNNNRLYDRTFIRFIRISFNFW